MSLTEEEKRTVSTAKIAFSCEVDELIKIIERLENVINQTSADGQMLDFLDNLHDSDPYAYGGWKFRPSSTGRGYRLIHLR